MYQILLLFKAFLFLEMQVGYKYIYKITSPIGRIYIGKTKRDIKYRKQEYERKKSPFGAIAKSIEKYGWKAHKFEVIYKVKCSDEELNRLEQLKVGVDYEFKHHRPT